MIENFIEYMWYLLTTPLKKIKKSLNNWYIFCRVLGRRFDEVKEDILRARDEGMVATCSHELLPVHGADRRLTRYEGEHLENFRSRIAMYEEICKLGGTNKGVQLVVKTLGFNNVSIVKASLLKQNDSRWAEFYVIIKLDSSEDIPIEYDILRQQVRKVKQVAALDNYIFVIGIFQNGVITNTNDVIARYISRHICKIHHVCNDRLVVICGGHNDINTTLHLNTKNNLWYLNGEELFSCNRIMDAYETWEDIV